MFALGFTVVAISAVAWFVHRVMKTDKELVEKRQEREMAFLAQNMQRPNVSVSQHPGNTNPASSD